VPSWAQIGSKAQRQGRPRHSDRQTVADYLEKWLAGAGVGPSTLIRYTQLVRAHLIPRLGAIPLGKLTSADCDEAYAAMMRAGLAPRTVGHAHRVLGRALKKAERDGLVVRDVTRLTEPPHVPHGEMQTLSSEQARTLLRAPTAIVS
jgi:site-specific recombinase XerD